MILRLLWISLIMGMFMNTTAIALNQTTQAKNKDYHWAVYYGEMEPANGFKEFDFLVFDGDKHPPLYQLLDQGKQVLGYISLGEAEKSRYYFPELQKNNLLCGPNPNWDGSFYVDIRQLLWPKTIIETIIPRVLHRGFEGIFIDTIDNACFLEQQDPEKYKGMRQAAIDLIRSIRHHYPQILIMINRGYDIIEDVAPFVDVVLGESLVTDYDFKTKQYKRATNTAIQAQIQKLKNAKILNPNLKIFTLDYCDPNNKAEIIQIYAQHRANGFIPYVSTIELTQIIPEPKA